MQSMNPGLLEGGKITAQRGNLRRENISTLAPADFEDALRHQETDGLPQSSTADAEMEGKLVFVWEFIAGLQRRIADNQLINGVGSTF